MMIIENKQSKLSFFGKIDKAASELENLIKWKQSDKKYKGITDANK